jgi:hypothetical protein
MDQKQGYRDNTNKKGTQPKEHNALMEPHGGRCIPWQVCCVELEAISNAVVNAARAANWLTDRGPGSLRQKGNKPDAQAHHGEIGSGAGVLTGSSGQGM